MDMTIQSVHFKADQKLLDYLEERLHKLEKYSPKIGELSVFLKLEPGGSVKDKIVELKANIPGQVLVSHGTSKTFEVACNEAAINLKKQIERKKTKWKKYRRSEA